MKMINIGILGPSEIALRRFMPALKKIKNICYIGIACANEKEWFGCESANNDAKIIENEKHKAKRFQDNYSGKIFSSYKELISSNIVDAIYIPLPPALHYKWAKKALREGKHVLVEKPSTTSYEDTKELVDIARCNNLSLHENYMFNFHNQIKYIENMILNNIIGETRLFRIAFGFPFRGNNDFRYNISLGGGALLDCGGYTIKLATRLLGKTIKMTTHQLNYTEEFDVDIFGSATFVNAKKNIAQISFGMDNSYKCELEIWGSKGSIYTNRILTAPSNHIPVVEVIKDGEKQIYKLKPDDSFEKSIKHFIVCISDKKLRNDNYEELLAQEKFITEFMKEEL